MSEQRQTFFCDEWLSDDRYRHWLAKVPGDRTKYRCFLCGETRALSNMGVKALMSHSKGTKHEKKTGAVQRIKTETRPLVSMWQSKSESKQGTSSNTNSNLESNKQCEAPSSITPNIDTDASDDMVPLTVPPPPTDTVGTKTQTSQSSISKFVLADDQWRAEILWTMKTIMSHYSANSSKGDRQAV